MAEDVLTTGFTFAWPWLLLLAPLPWLLRWLLPASPSGDLQALRVPWFSAVAGGKSGWLRRPWLALAATLVWLLLVVAAARPQWVGEIENLPVTGRDLRAAIDAVLSGEPVAESQKASIGCNIKWRAGNEPDYF